jgi:sugar lactone lactonase YvrE
VVTAEVRAGLRKLLDERRLRGGTRLALAVGAASVALAGFASAGARGAGAASPINEMTLVHLPANKTLPPIVLFDVAVDPAADIVAVTGNGEAGKLSNGLGGGRVWLINGHTHKITATVKLFGAQQAGVAFDPNTNSFVVADPSLPGKVTTTSGTELVNGAMVEIDPQSGRILKTVPIDSISGGVGVDPVHKMIYLTGPSYSVTRIDARTGAIVTPPTIQPEIPYPSSVSVDPRDDTMYVAGGSSEGTTGVWEVNQPADTDLGFTNDGHPFVTMATRGEPEGIVTDPATGNTYVSWVYQSAHVTVFKRDHHTGHALLIKGSNGAAEFGLALDTRRNVVFASSGEDLEGCPNMITEISGRTNAVLGRVYGVAAAGALAVDQNTDMVWATDEGKLASFREGFTDKRPKCGTGGGITLGG